MIVANPLPEGQSFDAWLGGLLREKPLVTMVSEMPYLALDWFLKKAQALGFAESHGAFSVQKYRTPPRIERGIVIYEAWGKTESKVVHGAVDFGMEITQSGSAIRNYGLTIVEEVLKSETGIYVNPGIKQQPAKYELAKMVLLNLYGAIFAEDKVLLFFNTKKERVEAILEYLASNTLFGDEPTINRGEGYAEFSVQMNTNHPALPLAQVRFELAKLGATHIETVPLDSCITGLDAVDF